MVGIKILGIIRPELRERFFSAESSEALSLLAVEMGGRLAWLDEGEQLVDTVKSGTDLSEVRVLITGWDTPRLTASLLGAMPGLELVMHTGAALEFLVSPELIEREIVVSQAGEAMARPVAEVALAFTLCLLHGIHRLDHSMRGMSLLPREQHEILGSSIGVVGASRTGRAYIKLIQSLGAEVLLFDPTVTEAEAEVLGVVLVDLPDLMRQSQVVSVHAPSLTETYHMVDESMLSLMPDGAALVNTARSWVVDEQALIAEVSTGRIDAAVDVYDVEPVPDDHPLLSLPGTLLTPHTAAGTIESRRRAGRIVVDEIRRFIAGRPLVHRANAVSLRTHG